MSVQLRDTVLHRPLQSKPRGVVFLDEVDEGSLMEMFACTATCKEMLTTQDPGEAMLAGITFPHATTWATATALALLPGSALLRLRETRRFGQGYTVRFRVWVQSSFFVCKVDPYTQNHVYLEAATL